MPRGIPPFNIANKIASDFQDGLSVTPGSPNASLEDIRRQSVPGIRRADFRTKMFRKMFQNMDTVDRTMTKHPRKLQMSMSSHQAPVRPFLSSFVLANRSFGYDSGTSGIDSDSFVSDLSTTSAANIDSLSDVEGASTSHTTFPRRSVGRFINARSQLIDIENDINDSSFDIVFNKDKKDTFCHKWLEHVDRKNKERMPTRALDFQKAQYYRRHKGKEVYSAAEPRQTVSNHEQTTENPYLTKYK